MPRFTSRSSLKSKKKEEEEEEKYAMQSGQKNNIADEIIMADW
jgi:hypothetical protein